MISLRLKAGWLAVTLAFACFLLSQIDGKACSLHGTSANCGRCGLTKLPSDLPSNLCRLDLSQNYINIVTGGVFQALAQLEELDLSDNDLLTLPHDAFRGLLRLTRLSLRHTGLQALPDALLIHVPRLVTLDLSGNYLTTVPTAALRHSSHLTSLDLGYNQLTTVGNYSFVFSSPTGHVSAQIHVETHASRGALDGESKKSRFASAGNGTSRSGLEGDGFNLRTLNLQNNLLSTLEPSAFVGLSQLLHLDLSHNELSFDHRSYPPGVFSPLVALQSLRVGANDHRSVGNYPENVVTLSSLRTLAIDTHRDSQFGQAFSQLRNLTSLLLDQGCKLTKLTNETFVVFKNSGLETLSMDRCEILSIETCAFCSLPRLRVLRLTHCFFIDFTAVLLSLYGLQNQTMSLIDLRSTHGRNYPTTMLESSNTKYLNNICVTSLNIANCAIVAAKRGAFQANSPLAKCLNHIDFSGNTFLNMPHSVGWSLISAFRNLTSFNAERQMVHARLSPQEIADRRASRHEGIGVQRHGLDGALILPLSPALEVVRLDGAIYILGDLPREIRVPHGARMTYLDVSYCEIYSCITTLTGLTSLRTLNLSGNECRVLSDDIFDHVTTLRHLRLADLPLDQGYVMSNFTRLINRLRLLEELDLSYNDLLRLPFDLLGSQLSLHSLYLTGNRFQLIPTNLELQTQLSLLDLSHNMLTSLLPHERRLLDNLAKTHTVHVRLRQNPLSCTCAELGFVHWLALTAVRLDGDVHITGYDDDFDDNGRDYPCVLDDGRMWSTGRVMADWDGHWRRCVGQTAFWAALVGLLLQLLGLVLTFIISRNWTYMRYAWRVLRHLPLPRRLTFGNDVIIFHVDRDLEQALKVKANLRRHHTLRVLIPYLAILPGENWAESILRHTDNSWKIVVLVTRNLLQDRWAGFLVHHAQRSISDTMPDRVLLLFFDPPADMATALPDGPHHPAQVSLQRLLQLVPDRNVFHVHRNTAPRHPVWRRLTDLVLYH